MLQLLSALRHKCAIGFVGGSNLIKQQEQLGTSQIPVTALFDFCFAENGLMAYRLGEQLACQSFVGWLGEDRYKKLVNFVLRYLADVECPVKRGTFVEFRFVFPSQRLLTAPPPLVSFLNSKGSEVSGQLTSKWDEHDRNGMINISPVGRNASLEERNDYEKYDAQHQIRSKFVAALKEKFPDYGLTCVLFRFSYPPPRFFLSRSLGSFYYHLV